MKASSKKSTERRIYIVLAAFLLAAVYLLSVIFKLGVLMHDYYKNKTIEQITTSSTLSAKRGSIYDANMTPLAISDTVWRVFVSTKEIRTGEKKHGIDYTLIISKGLADILSLDFESLYSKIKSSSVLDVTVKRAVDEEEYKRVLAFLAEYSLEDMVFTEAQSSRYYPSGTLAAHLLGFCGSDNQGLYGLEYQYEDILSGTDGYYLYAKDAGGRELDTEYSSYIEPIDGQSIVTTIDSYIQAELEAVIESARSNHSAQNRVCGIVMDTKTGAILAMATSSPFDPNSPFELDAVSLERLEGSGLEVGSEEYKKYKTELMQIMWSNKAVSETYEPGSTFKIITVSSALDCGCAEIDDTFSCKGYYEVGGWKIRCHKAGGHGSGFDLGYGLVMSCNPCMIALSERLGAERFYSYVEAFGLLEKTGIDLPSEAGSIFHELEAMGATELATASFGQRFKVSVINLLSAIGAVANGGKLMTPYVVEKIISPDGTISYTHEPEVRAEVISEEVARLVSEVLVSGVNNGGGAKNAGVYGYDIAAKTGTSQKFDVLDENGNSYLRIGSTVAFSTDEDSGIAMIIVVDEPKSTVKYGSVVAAPYVSKLMEKVLPYLEFMKTTGEVNTAVESYIGLTADGAKARLSKLGISCEVVGGGTVVISQSPSPGETFTYPISKVYLYTDESSDTVLVPNFVGMTLSEVISLASSVGLNLRICGMSAQTPSRLDRITEQSLPPGSKTLRGTIIEIRAVNYDFED